MFSVKLAFGDQQECHRMSLRVCPEQDVILCYGHRCGADPGSGEPALRHRIPLLAATAGLSAGGCHRTVTVATADSESKALVRGLMDAAPGPPPLAEGTFSFECASASDARRLLMQLQQAGCVLEGLTERYQLVRRVGKGSFGDVFEAVDLLTNRVVAVKIFSKIPPKHLHPLREATLLRRSYHSFFVGFEGVYFVTEPSLLSQCGVLAESSWAIVTEFLSGRELFEVLCQRGALSEGTARELSRQMLAGLASLHRRGIVHRDIKPENVMILADRSFRLVDFGLAAPISDPVANAIISGSPGHIAPELLRKEPLSDKADCFSMGVLLHCVLCGGRPFKAGDAHEILKKNYKCKVDPANLAHLSPEAADLVLRLLTKDPEKRPSAAECLEHPWLRPADGSRPAPLGRRPRRPLEAEAPAAGVGPARRPAEDVIQRKAVASPSVQSTPTSPLRSKHSSGNSMATTVEDASVDSCAFSSVDSAVTSRSSSKKAASVVNSGLLALRKLRSLSVPPTRTRRSTAVSPEQVMSSQSETPQGSARNSRAMQ